MSTTGIEFDFLAQLSQNIRVTGGAAWIDAEIEEYPGGPCSGGQQFRGECPEAGLQDLSGGELPFSPDWKLNFAATYTFLLEGDFDVGLTGSVRSKDDVQYSMMQDSETIGDSYTIYDLSLAVAAKDDTWRATFFVKNLTDEFYPTAIIDNNENILPNAYNHRYSKQSERTFGLQLGYRWL